MLKLYLLVKSEIATRLLVVIFLTAALAWSFLKPKNLDLSHVSDSVLEETASPEESSSEKFWLNSGAYFYVFDGVGSTVTGSLEEGSKWQQAFWEYNPESTQGGFYPQNIFRLLTRDVWQNSQSTLEFVVHQNNLAKTPERNESNGVLLFMRYIDSDNLYYAGLRVDGHAVLKRKTFGEYETLAEVPVIEGTYHSITNPNLLKLNSPYSIRSSIKNNSYGDPVVDFYYRENPSDAWHHVFSYLDMSENAIRATAHNGIRTDFMDVEFLRYEVKDIF